jgi:hypothetical protein
LLADYFIKSNQLKYYNLFIKLTLLYPMQKQLVLAALFATVNAADCTDANVVMAKASKAALTAATAGLTTAKSAALAA